MTRLWVLLGVLVCALAASLAACDNSTLISPPSGNPDGNGFAQEAGPSLEGGRSDGPIGVCPGHCSGGSMQCCGSACVDTSVDPGNCGGCGAICTAPSANGCASSQCTCNGALFCSGAQTCCGTSGCVNTQTDSTNCGSCGTRCPTGTACAAGVCGGCGATTCSPSQTCCSMTCADLTSDSQNCGACGKKCPGGTSCMGGKCLCAAGGMPCPAAKGTAKQDLTCCGSDCVDLCSSAGNCGKCGAVCGTAALPLCSTGGCLFSCPPTLSLIQCF